MVEGPSIEGRAVERKLAAIFAADVAGYSRLMAQDEVGTLHELTDYRAILDGLVATHRGRIFTTAGDSVMAEFASTVDAVACALAVQAAIAEANAQRRDAEPMQFRIGIHLGDVIVQEGNLFGDGVNIAARLQALAEPGGICISAALRDQIGPNLPVALSDLGEQQVKNLSRPVRAFAIAARNGGAAAALGGGRRWPRRSMLFAALVALIAIGAGGAWWWLWAGPQSRPGAVSVPAAGSERAQGSRRLSIVVLPFANLSNDPEQQYFADGITEDLTTDLSRIAGSFVIARNTAFRYGGKPVDAREIGRALDVRYILEGSVRRSEAQLRVNVQLIDAETEAHLWADRFDRSAGDLWAIENEITGRIARAVQAQLYIAEGNRQPDHPDTLDYLMRGRSELSKTVSRTTRDQAVAFFERALALDPASVEAQVWLANGLVSRVIDEIADNPAAEMQRADELIRKALIAAPNHAMVHHTRGQFLRAQGFYADAIPEYESAIALDRNLPHAYAWLADCKLKTGSIDEVIPLVEHAIQLSPQDPSIGPWHWRIGIVHVYRSELDEAIASFGKAQSGYATRGQGAGYWVHGWLAAAYALKGEEARAKAELNEAWKYPFFKSVAAVKADPIYSDPRIAKLAEPTFIAGLRLAGMPEN